MNQMIFYAFTQKFGKDYLQIIKFEAFNKLEAEILKLDNYDYAFKVPERVMIFYNELTKNGKTVLIKKRNNSEWLSFEDFVIFSSNNANDIIEKVKKIDNEIDDEDIKNEIFFNEKKEEYMKDLFNLLFPSVNLFQIMNLYMYISDWSYMFNKGFVITDDNKEDIFIDIIEKDDDQLLNKLVRFLTEKEELDKFRHLIEMWFGMREEFDYMSYWDYDSLEEALKDLETKYLEYKKNIDDIKENADERVKSDLALYYSLIQKKKKESN